MPFASLLTHHFFNPGQITSNILSRISFPKHEFTCQLPMMCSPPHSPSCYMARLAAAPLLNSGLHRGELTCHGQLLARCSAHQTWARFPVAYECAQTTKGIMSVFAGAACVTGFTAPLVYITPSLLQILKFSFLFPKPLHSFIS